MSVAVVDQPSCNQSSELVWDHDQSATAIAGRLTLCAGETENWTPALLLATAAGASVLTTFARLAGDAGIRILGYAAQHTAAIDASGAIEEVHLTPCITVSSEEAARQARTIWTHAIERAPVLQTLKCRVIGEPHVVTVSDERSDDQEC